MESVTPVPVSEDDRLWDWQRRLLPVVLVALGLLAVFFFASTFIQLERFNTSVAYHADGRLDATLKVIDARAAKLPDADAVALLQWKTLALLEADVVSHRYQQVNATLLLRAWTRHIGFVTGMILAFVGAIFILAKLSTDETRLGGESGGVKATLATTSPGIVLAVLGTALMLTTLSANFTYNTVDVPVYLSAVAHNPATAMPPPDPAAIETIDGKAVAPGSDEQQAAAFGGPPIKEDSGAKPVTTP